MHRTLLAVPFLALAALVQLPVEPLPSPAAPGPTPDTPNARVAAVLQSIRDGRFDVLPPGVNDIPAQTPSPLAWTDIPDLLRLSGRTDPIPKPVSPSSSMREASVTIETGAVALWLVEGVRRNRRFPTMHVIIGKDTDEHLEERAAFYRRWWKDAADRTPEASAAIDPLATATWRW